MLMRHFIGVHVKVRQNSYYKKVVISQLHQLTALKLQASALPCFILFIISVFFFRHGCEKYIQRIVTALFASTCSAILFKNFKIAFLHTTIIICTLLPLIGRQYYYYEETGSSFVAVDFFLIYNFSMQFVAEIPFNSIVLASRQKSQRHISEN